MADDATYRLALFGRLQPRTPWTGGRTADTDVLTLEEAARFASVHAGQEITPADFLRAAARGEIRLHAIVHRSARTRPCAPGVEPLNNGEPVPAGAISLLPIVACRELAAAGRASWRTFERVKQDEKLPGAWWYFDAWELEPDEPPFETVPADCRVTGYDTHALADAYLLDVEESASLPPGVRAIPGKGRVMVEVDTSEGGYVGRAVMTREEFEAEQRAKRERHARGNYTVCEAAQRLADANGFDAASFVKNRMLPAIEAGQLRAYAPEDGGPVKGRPCRDFADWVRPAQVDAWLASEGFPFRWDGPAGEPEREPDDTGAAGEPKGPPAATVFRLRSRRDALDPAIDAAIAAAAGEADHAAVWNEFLALADAADRPAPLLGIADGEVKYRGADAEVKLIGRDAFIKRLKRRR